MTPTEIEMQLQQRLTDYPPTRWGRKQSNQWDDATNFIYRTPHWAELRTRTAPMPEPLRNYAVQRWFNFWSAMAVEQIFCALPNVVPQTNTRDRLVDFSLHGITFDHKTTVFPRKYPHPPRYAYENPADLIRWLYHKQSQQRRHHLANRLFIVLWASDGQHWQLRADISKLKRCIERYVGRFEPTRLTRLPFGQQTALADLIWCVRKG